MPLQLDGLLVYQKYNDKNEANATVHVWLKKISHKFSCQIMSDSQKPGSKSFSLFKS